MPCGLTVPQICQQSHNPALRFVLYSAAEGLGACELLVWLIQHHALFGIKPMGRAHKRIEERCDVSAHGKQGVTGHAGFEQPSTGITNKHSFKSEGDRNDLPVPGNCKKLGRIWPKLSAKRPAPWSKQKPPTPRRFR